jgi:hypothetical protein
MTSEPQGEHGKNIDAIFNENRGSCYRKISDAPWWPHLDFDSEQDEDLMFIEIWSSVVSNEHFKVYRIIDASAIEDNHPNKTQIQKEFKEPGSNFVHPSIFIRGRILNDFEALAIKYGVDIFENYIKDLYNNYPSPENQSTIDYIKTKNENSIFLISHKWKLISELFSSIHNYFEDKGVTL